MNGWRLCLLQWALLVPLGGNAAQPLRLVADPWPPFNDQALPHNGVASDLVTTALQRAGYTTRYAQVPWERAVRGLQQDIYDVLINAWYTDERAIFGYFSQPYLINRIRFLQRKGSGIRFNQLSDLYPYSIAVVRGYAYSSEFDQDSRLTKVGVVGFEVAARMLQARRVQLTLEDELVARFHLNRSLAGIRDQLEFLPQPLSENGLHILISRRHPQHQKIAQDFNRAIDAMRADGSYAQIFRRHGL
ncbi:amino acid ABC transporter substrate-binding protein [Pseudomonas sp. HMWF032]|nr:MULTISPECIES: transporter substrate-binding domain-containing protein [unclassified Pseudomonas]PTS85127.1 amino acid ABC transporter substrate-binding protein [Pseudomonas sp. HMWF032]PTT86229.1 amino acid ABC transporter substrate-binding protein [Pseudomonas sp. HMWF010]WAC42770.1 transporter substrate-binding domain-containing protein [Pseudomonas sp. SL4(2022)]